LEPVAAATSNVLEQVLENGAAEVEKADSTASEAVKEETSEEVSEPVVKVKVDTDVEVNGDIETTHTHVQVEMPAGSPELPLPEDTEAMIAKAKEMVEAAVKGQELAVSTSSKQLKRKAEEVEEEVGEEEETLEPAPAKKAKVDSALKKERVKTRALIGLSATLAIGAMIPYVFNAF